MQASLNGEVGKPSYWLHEVIARGDLQVRASLITQQCGSCAAVQPCSLCSGAGSGLHQAVVLIHACLDRAACLIW
jgi:hypothetical protein